MIIMMIIIHTEMQSQLASLGLAQARPKKDETGRQQALYPVNSISRKAIGQTSSIMKENIYSPQQALYPVNSISRKAIGQTSSIMKGSIFSPGGLHLKPKE